MLLLYYTLLYGHKQYFLFSSCSFVGNTHTIFQCTFTTIFTLCLDWSIHCQGDFALNNEEFR